MQGEGVGGGRETHYWRCHVGQINTKGDRWRNVMRVGPNEGGVIKTSRGEGDCISISQERILSMAQSGKIWWDVCISICASCLNMPHRTTTHSHNAAVLSSMLSAECNKAEKNLFGVKDQEAVCRLVFSCQPRHGFSGKQQGKTSDAVPEEKLNYF